MFDEGGWGETGMWVIDMDESWCRCDELEEDEVVVIPVVVLLRDDEVLSDPGPALLLEVPSRSRCRCPRRSDLFLLLSACFLVLATLSLWHDMLYFREQRGIVNHVVSGRPPRSFAIGIATGKRRRGPTSISPGSSLQIRAPLSECCSSCI